MKKIYLSLIVTLFGVLFSVQSLNAANVVLRAGGTITNPADWGAAPNGLTGTLTSFTATNTYSFTGNNTALSLSTTWSITAASQVVFGNGTNAFAFTLASGGQVGISAISPPKVTFANNCTLTLDVNDTFNNAISKTVFSTGSTVIYGPGYSNPVKATFTSPYYNLVMNNSSINLNGSNINVSGDLTIDVPFDMAAGSFDITGNLVLNADLTMSDGVVTLGGAMSGAGSFVGDNTGSTLIFNGTGAIGTLNMSTPPSLLTNLTINSGTLTLGNNIIIDGGLIQLNGGSLDLNGTTLSIETTAAADFAGGEIIGSSTSNFSCSAGAGISGSFLMDASNNSLQSLILNSSGQTLSLGNSLTITDFVQVDDGTLASGGNLVLSATSLLSARVASLGATGAITGNVNAQTFVPGGSTGWALWGSNGVSGQTVANWDAQVPMTCENCLYGVTGIGYYFESIQGWDETNVNGVGDEYDTTITAGTALTPGRGFWMYVGSGFSSTTPYTLSSSGPLVTGPVTIPITGGGNDYNLIANPYASPISWDAIYAANSGSLFTLSASIDGYNADGGGVVSSYVATGLGNAPTGIDNVIPAGQGFYVNAGGISGNLIIDESMKVSNNTNSNPVIRTSASNTASNNSWFRLKVKGANDFDETTFGIVPGATANFDKRWDGRKSFQTPGYAGYPGAYSKYTTISSRLNNEDYSINSLPPLTQSLTVPVLVRVAATGSYTISAKDFSSYTGCIMIKDKLTNALTDLRNNDYVFTISDTTSAPRFDLLLCENGKTTVSLSELKASLSNISINQDEFGAFVNTHFEKNTKATISVYNVMGQQLIKDLTIEGTDTTTRLDLDVHNQVVIIKVTTEKESSTKKIITH